MPQHDPTPAQEGIPPVAIPTPATLPDAQVGPEGDTVLEQEQGLGSAGSSYATRTERREAVEAGWRADMMKHVTPVWVWALLAFAYLGTLCSAILLGDPLIGVGIGLIATAAAWLGWWRLSRSDRHFRWLAALTPVVDRSTLQGEATILAAAIDALSATLRNTRSDSDVRLRAMQNVLTAAAPIMARGDVRAEDATVEGYPAWPEVDRTEMPGQDGDFLSVHLIRLDATAKRLITSMNEEILFQETVARIAAEVVPPLRAMEAVVEGSARN